MSQSFAAEHLSDYEDFLDPAKIYSLIALSSATNRAYSLCSRAFIKLESLDTISVEDKKAYEDLAVEIFTRYCCLLRQSRGLHWLLGNMRWRSYAPG